MADNIIPELRHKAITRTTTAQDNSPSVIMDDTVYTMESTSAIMGGLTTPEAEIPIGVARSRVEGR